MKKKYSLLLSLIVVICCTYNLTVCAYTNTVYLSATNTNNDLPASQRDVVPSIEAPSAIIINAQTGQIIYDKNSHQRNYPASITKIMTTYLALQNGNLSSTITMSEDAVWGIPRDSAHIALDVGEHITLEQALYAVMMVSANEAAWAVAEHISGTLDNFAELMTSTAAELGCEDTNFVNANGLHDSNHYTTAYDMALITKAALELPEFRTITNTVHYIIPATDVNPDIRDMYTDTKMLLPSSEFYYEYCEGGKTGYTDEAHATLVTWAKKGDTELICVLMNNSTATSNYNDTRALYEYFFDNLDSVSPLANYSFSETDIANAESYLNSFFNCTNLGELTLSADTSMSVLSTESETTLNTKLEFSTDELESGIIGSLYVTDSSGLSLVSTPVYYSGYINSSDPEAVDDAIAMGLIEKESTRRKGSFLPAIIIIIVILAIAAAIYFRIRYIQRQREMNRRRHTSNRSYR